MEFCFLVTNKWYKCVKRRKSRNVRGYRKEKQQTYGVKVTIMNFLSY
jgi:hypothetical protein